MVGAEALMRWQRDGRLVPPGDFIPLAEETGLIVPLSEWALREAAKQARSWQQAFGFADSIAVNLPNRLFERTDLVEHIHNAVTTYGVPHRAIELEITETALISNFDAARTALEDFKRLGIRIAIDDFGTGYSSLAYLRDLPVDILKIDQSFVREIGLKPAEGHEDAPIIRTIIALAHNLGMVVVAEGVETEAQRVLIGELGCDMIQGYLLSRPLPLSDIIGWLNERRRRGDHIG